MLQQNEAIAEFLVSVFFFQFAVFFAETSITGRVSQEIPWFEAINLWMPADRNREPAQDDIGWECFCQVTSSVY
jgi:hypothetical protein